MVDYTYDADADGDQTTRTLAGTSSTLTYDEEDQLTSTGTGGATFAYDALGRRMTRTVSGTTTSFTYDGSAVLTETTGSTTKPYTYGNELVRQGSLYPAYDGLGNARRWLSPSDMEQSAAYIDGFGNVTSQYGVAQNYQYGAGSGYRSDGDVGLLLVGARYYDPQVGRFISRDTELDQQPYAYCDGDPVNATDPSGHGTHRNQDIVAFAAVAIAIVLLVAPEIGVPILIAAGAAGGGVGGLFGGYTDGDRGGTLGRDFGVGVGVGALVGVFASTLYALVDGAGGGLFGGGGDSPYEP